MFKVKGQIKFSPSFPSSNSKRHCIRINAPVVEHICYDYNARISFFAVEKIPCEEKDDKDISKLVSGIVKCSINRQISYKTVGPNEVCLILYMCVCVCVHPTCASKNVGLVYFIKKKKNGVIPVRIKDKFIFS